MNNSPAINSLTKSVDTLKPTVLLISEDAALCSAVRSALEDRDTVCRVASVCSFAAARHSVEIFAPDVIVLEEATLPAVTGTGSPGFSQLADVVAALAGFAPVVILGKEEPSTGLAALIAAGAADFVRVGQSHLLEAAACVEKRLQSARRLNPEISERRVAHLNVDFQYDDSFGEILRHELNNPLTGILGNAELLLAEVHRHHGAPLTGTGLKRLETIAALAVRMRETVRRLSQACEAHQDLDPSA